LSKVDCVISGRARDLPFQTGLSPP
jgi:hypothetical protein